jgi:hypothetical protein
MDMLLSLHVTEGVQRQAAARGLHQRQITVTPSLGGAIRQGKTVVIELTGNSRWPVLIGGDTNSVWRSHISEDSLDLYDRLFEFLAQMPGQTLRVMARVVGT